MLQVPGDKDILYQDNTGLYLVGASAQNQISMDDTNDTEGELFGRNRYNNKRFQILLAVGLGIGCMGNHIKQKEPATPIAIQTGLPTAYMAKDQKAIIRAFTQHYQFRLKIGAGGWEVFDIHVSPENVYVMPQPAGTLYSILIDEKGHYLPDARNTLNKNILIVDGGFGTFDPYGMVGRKLVLKESLSNIGMRRILEEAASMIFHEYGEEIRVPAMQKYLEKGYVPVLNEEEMKTENVDLKPYIEKASDQVCKESIALLKSVTNYLRDYDIMVMTGGTCSLWLDQYREHFKGMKGLEIIAGNRNDGLPLLFSNVRGYYMLRYANIIIGA